MNETWKPKDIRLENGINNFWTTSILKREFDVTEDMIHMGMQKKVHPDIEKLSLKFFEEYLKSELDIDLTYYETAEVQGWVNRYENTNMNYHSHHGSQLSAVFYLVMEGNGGEIEFYDPRQFAARGYDLNWRKLFNSIVFKPTAGDVVIFPSYLYHSVHVANGFKMSIPVDLFLRTA